MSSLAYSGLGELYQRRVPQSDVRRWQLRREAYERDLKAYERREFKIVARAPKVIPAKPIPLYTLCDCGCGQRTSEYRTLYLPGHRPLRGVHRMAEEDLQAQLSRIPDNELGRLAKILLLRELGRES